MKKIDSHMKISSLMGMLTNIIQLFGHLKTTVLSILFNSYCCAFYGFQNLRLDSICFNNVLIAWNKGVRRMLNLPSRAHT